MFRGLFNAIKWGAIGLVAGQLVSGYTKDKTFKSKVDHAKGFEKAKQAWDYLLSTNKALIKEHKLNEMLEGVKKTASQAQVQLQDLDMPKIQKQIKKEVIAKTKQVKKEATQKRNEILIMLQEKLHSLERQVEKFEGTSKDLAEDVWTETYRQLASRFSLFKKQVLKYIEEGVLQAEEKFHLEKKVKYLGEKIEEMKSGK